MKIILSIIACAFLAGCSTATPKDYWQDTTPGHSGEQWVGGE